METTLKNEGGGAPKFSEKATQKNSFSRNQGTVDKVVGKVFMRFL